MKKTISIFMATLLVFCMLCPVALAVDNSGSIQPYYLRLSSFNTELTLESINKVSCYAMAHSDTASDDVKISLSLQKQSGSQWTTVATWSKTGSNTTVIDEDYTLRERGTYRLNAIAYVFDSNGTQLESPMRNSYPITY